MPRVLPLRIVWLVAMANTSQLACASNTRKQLSTARLLKRRVGVGSQNLRSFPGIFVLFCFASSHSSVVCPHASLKIFEVDATRSSFQWRGATRGANAETESTDPQNALLTHTLERRGACAKGLPERPRKNGIKCVMYSGVSSILCIYSQPYNPSPRR